MLELNVQNVFGQQPFVECASDPALSLWQQAIDETTWAEYFQTWIAQPNLGLPPATGYEITLRLTDDAEIQSLNAQYRHIDQPTDVLAFAALEDNILLPPTPVDLPIYLGDIIISIDTAQKQAVAQGHSLSIELLWLASHGFLHLLGWDHPDDESLAKMLTCQDLLLGTILVFTATQETSNVQL